MSEVGPTRSGGGCGGVLGTLVVVGAVIAGGIHLSPDLDFGQVRDAVRYDGQDGVPGSGGPGYTFLATGADGAPVTWPCQGTIEVQVNPEGAPEGYAASVEAAVARVNEASGFTLEVTGETDDRRLTGRGVGPVLIAWSDEEELPELAGATAGLGGASYLERPGGRAEAVGGMVVLDTEVGWGRGRYAEVVLVHELVHVLGLGHSDDTSELMAAEHRGQSDLGPGDLAGLAALRQAACG